jgi:alpha-tubulin suppressor-like RCC1 family protein
VKRWRDGQMALRWCAAGMLEAKKQFRRVNGHLHLKALRTALEAHVAADVTPPSSTLRRRRWPHSQQAGGRHRNSTPVGTSSAQGQLGVNGSINTDTPAPVCEVNWASGNGSTVCPQKDILKDVIAISAGGFYSLAIVGKSAAGVDAAVAWGSNIGGALGNGTDTATISCGGNVCTPVPEYVCSAVTAPAPPTPVPALPTRCGASDALSGVHAVSAGIYNSLALLSASSSVAAGTVVAWGDNTYCEVGVGDYCNAASSTSGPGPSSFTGTNNCNPSTSTSPTNCAVQPMYVQADVSGNPLLSGVIQISAGGDQDLALLGANSSYGASAANMAISWGDNNDGQLGQGTSVGPDSCFDNNSSVNTSIICDWRPDLVVSGACPSPVADLSGVTSVSAGFFYSMAVVSNLSGGGTVCSWGGGGNGDLGNGASVNEDAPVAVHGVCGYGYLGGATAVSAGSGGNSIALVNPPFAATGTVVTWGDNSSGGLGISATTPCGGSTTPTSTDTPVNACALSVTSCPSTGFLSGVTAISAGGGFDVVK